MQHHVVVDGLPEGFRIPSDLADRFYFEPGTHRLVHDGFMSKTEYDRLVGLTSDWPFIRKLEELFMMCTYEDERPRKGLRGLFSAFGRTRH
jgi:hypothetical protein